MGFEQEASGARIRHITKTAAVMHDTLDVFNFILLFSSKIIRCVCNHNVAWWNGAASCRGELRSLAC
jgi:hypothetical protein